MRKTARRILSNPTSPRLECAKGVDHFLLEQVPYDVHRHGLSDSRSFWIKAKRNSLSMWRMMRMRSRSMSVCESR